MKNRLGRGLKHLIPTGVGEMMDLPFESIKPSSWQPRRNFNKEKLNELVLSLKTTGLIQPILVRPMGDDYELIAGERRLRAVQLAGFKTIKALVMGITDDIVPEVSLIENIQREELTPLEMAESLKRILEVKNLTQDEVAERIGVSRPQVTNLLRLLSLPSEVKEFIQEGKLSFGHARALVSLPDEEIIKLANKIVERELSVRETEKLAKIYNSLPKEKSKLLKETRDGLLEGFLRERYFPHARVFLKKDGLYIKVSRGESTKLIEFLKEVFDRYVNIR